ncbi:hypothetical protein BDW22DRAFT_1358216 [Trametopsis cervina]|nr:hypothetical protein BDW22DRAFT_1358216 [Trametopsis cervina]
MINYRLVIAAACVAIGLILYLFYWNRFIGFVLGRIIRFVFWNQKESSVWVNIGSIHFSILSGRILLKDFSYHSSNQTIRIVKGQVSWRYWIRAPADEDDLSHARVVGEDVGRKPQKTPLSCRVHMSFHGLEWFIYNRTAAYDNIVSAMEPSSVQGDGNRDGRASMEGIGSLRKIFSWTSAVPDSTHIGPPISLLSSIYTKTPNVLKGWIERLKQQMPNLDPKDLLPLGIEVRKGAIIAGNESTPTLFVAEFESAEGTYGIVASRSKYDHYKQVINLRFHDAIVHFVDNDRYESPMIATGEMLQRRVQASDPRPLRSFSYLTFKPFSKLWQRFKLWQNMSTHRRNSHFNMHGGIGASWSRRRPRKVVEDETPLGVDFAALEYAKEHKIMEAPIVEFLYYADCVGQVPGIAEQTRATEDPFDIGNGDLPPQWGIDLAICGGIIRYGPWADRQRAILQQAFFPSTFTDATPFDRLKPGDARVWPSLSILIELKDGVTVQIPFREPSKNWQWDGEVDIPNRPRKREAASVHVRAGDNSTISYNMPMVATSRGYEPSLHISLDTITITSSLNDIRILGAESCVVRCDLPSPLRWNEQRQWNFSISLRDPIIYILRDHINMFTDLGKDWSSGPPSDYNRFIPMLYSLSVEMKNYDLKLYVNDHNIIDKPLIPEENALLSLHGAILRQTVSIPLTKYRPDCTMVSFTTEAPDVMVSLTLPKWNTRSLYAQPHRSSSIGRIGRFQLDASYCYFGEVHPENIDQLKLMFAGTDVVYKACGWTIRYFMSLRNNYFGSFTHFSTLYEYLQKRDARQPLGDPVDLQYREGGSNTLQVELGLSLNKGLIVAPAGLRGYEVDAKGTADSNDIGRCTMLSLPELQLQLRSHDYYMEMSLNVDCIAITTHPHCAEDLRAAWATQRNAKEVIMIDGLDIVAHRLFGPLPRTATYFCIWEFHVCNVAGHLTALDARTLAASGRQFGLNFTDPLNAPAPEYEIPTDPDVTFFKFAVDQVNIVWHAGNAAAELSLPKGLRLDHNDVAGKNYKSVTSIRIPQASTKLLISRSEDQNDWHEAMNARLDLNVDMYSTPPGWQDKARAQSEFLAAQDSHTERVMFLYMPDQAFPHDIMSTGRGLLDTDFYLPQIRIPKAHSRSSIVDHDIRDVRVPNGGYVPSPLALPRHLVSYSDSDGEEYVSEADRDARIAQLRPISRLVVQNSENDSISSGEESDTDDLIEGDHSDSEAEKTKGPMPTIIPAISHYGRHVRNYGARFLRRPSWWHGSPFQLRRDGLFSQQPSSVRKLAEDSSTQRSNHENAESALLPSNISALTSTIRIASKTGLVMTLTPLILPALSVLSSDVVDNQLSPEIRFDALLADHLQSVKDEDGDGSGATIFDMYLQSLHVTMMQLLPVSSADIADSHRTTSTRSQRPSYAEIFSSGLHATSVSRDSPCNMVLADQLVLGFGAYNSPSPTCHVACTSSRAWLQNKDASLTLGQVNVNITQSAFAQLVPSVITLASFARELQQPLAAIRTGCTSELNHEILGEALRHGQGRITLDPLSTIQPSYLIQSGRPHRMRTDPGFKYIVSLRHHLQFLDPSKLRELFSTSAHPPPENTTSDSATLLRKHLAEFLGDTEPLSHSLHSPLGKLLGRSTHAETNKDSGYQSLQLDSATFKLLHLRAVVQSEAGMCSEFTVGAATVSARLRSTTSYPHGPLNPTKSTTTLLSLAKDKGRQDIMHIGVILSVGDVTLSIYPSLVPFAQSMVHTLKLYQIGTFAARRDSSRSPPRPTPLNNNPIIYVDFALTTRSVKFKASAEKLLVEYKTSAIDFASTLLLKPPNQARRSWDVSMNHSMVFDEIRLQACAVADISSPNDHGVLAAFILGGGRISAIVKRDWQSHPTVRLAVGLDYIHLNVPRSAIRLYRFMEEWRADYFPGLQATIQDLLSELQESAQFTDAKPARRAQGSTYISFQVEAKATSLRVSLQVMRGTWLSWEMGHIVTYALYENSSSARDALNFGLQIASQNFIISSKERASDPVPNTRVKVPLPTFSVTCHHDKGRIEGLALVEMFTATVKPSHWDTLLTVQQKFGQDFNDLVSIIEESRSKVVPTQKEYSPESLWRYRILARMKGFRVGLESGLSTILLECNHIGGAITNDHDLKWHVELSDLTLALAPQKLNMRVLPQASDKGRRSAFVSINARVEMEQRKGQEGHVMNVSVTKIHAVMQPSSIGELGDFADHIQAEVALREEQRAQDLAEFKEKTRNLLRTLEITTESSQLQDSSISWVDQHSVDISVANIGIAFPLTLNQDVRNPPLSPTDEGAVRAFLFSVKSITFNSQRAETGKASMKGFAFQFVSRFRQTDERDFSGHSHPARNRLLYPEMAARLRIEKDGSSRQLHVTADVDGFILDVESSIPTYISSLIDVYRHGMDRVERFSTIPRTPTQVADEHSRSKTTETGWNNLLTSNIFMALTFESGRVRLYSQAYVAAARTRAISVLAREPSDDHFRELGAEVFDLPVVSVWGEYRASLAASKVSSNHGHMEPSTLLFKSTVHSSQNTLRPTLLPFLGEVVKNVEDRMRQTSKQEARSLAVTSPRGIALHLPHDDITNPVSSLQISLSLRIDQSKLELSCQPDVNVIAGLNWDSGGFVVNISPGAHRVTFSGSVGGLTVGLKHGFLSEDCMKLHARNLAFTVDFSKARGSTVSSVSVVCDTEFSGGVRFSRLQDILCFKAVWLDRIPVLSAPPATPSAPGPRSTGHTSINLASSGQELTTVLILRLREVRLDIDLGQSITSIQLNLRDAILRTRMNEAVSEVSLSVSDVAATASGNVTGQIDVPGFMFQTTRKERSSSDNSGRLLDLQMTSGPLVIDLESEYQKILLYRAEPLDIHIYDDWSRFSPIIAADDRRVRLTFTVKGSAVTAVMSVGTVPKLVSYGNKFKANLKAQKEGARRESKAFRMANSPKPENPLSEVANAIFSSARNKLMEEPGFDGAIGQRLSLKLQTLQLVVFPRTLTDPELAQFIGANIHARLDRVVESDTLPPARDLQLSFSSISISKVTSLNYPLVAKLSRPSTNCQEWLALLTKDALEATIFSLPAMFMQMHSDEVVEEGLRVLPYDFTSKFSDGVGVREEDIYITLNMSLYSWLTILRKTFAREMEQVQASADARGVVGSAQIPALRRSKAPDVLQIRQEKETDPSRSHTSSPGPVSAKGRAPLLHTKSTPTRFNSLSPSTSEFPTSPHSSQTPSTAAGTRFPISSPVEEAEGGSRAPSPGLPVNKKAAGLSYRARRRTIERLTLKQLGEATPDVMHPFFMKTAGFSLEDSLPQYVHEYATMPTEEIMKALLKLYSKQLKVDGMQELL